MKIETCQIHPKQRLYESGCQLAVRRFIARYLGPLEDGADAYIIIITHIHRLVSCNRADSNTPLGTGTCELRRAGFLISRVN